jgi:hypothetical protein
VLEAEPHLKEVEAFKTVLSGDREAIAKLSLKELEEIAMATLTRITVDEFQAQAAEWIEPAKRSLPNGGGLRSEVGVIDRDNRRQGSHVPYKSLAGLRAAYTPAAVRAVSYLPD